jgi:hypothetical protein
MFQVSKNFTKISEDDADVDILVIYRYDIPARIEKMETFNSSIEDLDDLFNQTLLDRSFF